MVAASKSSVPKLHFQKFPKKLAQDTGGLFADIFLISNKPTFYNFQTTKF